MKNIQKKISLLAILCFSFSMAFAQTIKAVDNKGTIVDIVSSPWLTKEGGTAIYNKNTGNVVIGNGTEPATVNPNAALQFTQTDKGIMIPKVALVELFNSSPFATLGPSDDGLLVYNTTTGGSAPFFFSPGFYYWSAINSWIPLITRNGNVLFSLTGVFDGDISGLATQTLIKPNAVTTGKIAAGAVTNAKLQHSTITINGTPVALGESATITPSPVGTSLQDKYIWVGDGDGIAQEVEMGGDVTMNSSGFTTIGNEKVTTAKIADNAVTALKIANDAVTSAKIVDATILVADIANNAVETDKIKDLAVTTGKIAVGAVGTGKIADNAVTALKIANNAVTTDKINNSAVTALKIASNAVTTDKINNSAVTTDKIGAGAVTYAKIQNVGATNSVLGRVSAGAGAIEEIQTTGSGNVVRANAPTFTGLVTTAASTTDSAGFRIPHGTAPSSPVDGDMWTDQIGGLYLQQTGTPQRLASTGATNLDFTGTTLTFGSSTAFSTIGIGTGAIPDGVFKTIDIGTGGLAGSITDIAIGGTDGSTTRINGSVQHTYTSTYQDLTLTRSHRYVVVRASVAITLPDALNVQGTIYTIIAKANGVTISSFKNFSDTNTTTIAQGTSITIISNGQDWEQVN